MGSFNDFWNTSRRANNFLRTGIVNDTVRNGTSEINRGTGFLSSSNGYSPSIGGDDKFRSARDNSYKVGSGTSSAGGGSLSTGADCVSTSQCPSGWGCVNGVCQQLNGGGSGSGGPNQINSPSGGGPCDPQDPESPCNSGGSGSCQQTPQCGDTDEEARDCCGTRCCSFGSASSARPGVHCFCGECPPQPGCSSFCDSYLKANGIVGPGCKEGLDGNSCTGCTECDGNVGGECKPIFIGADCWCEGEGCNEGNCEKCVTDSESDDYGDCALDATDCQQCATITNHVCPCGRPFQGPVILPPITKCKSYGQGGLLPINLAQQEAARQCDEICNQPDTKDPCEPEVSSSKYCTDTGTGVATCPAGSKQTGFLEAGGERCVFCETPDYSNLPESCKECDCNCNNDCPACQLCGADGSCYPDPACEPIEDGVLMGTYPSGAQERIAGDCQQQIYVKTWNVEEQGACCPGGDNFSCGCDGRSAPNCNPYYACLPQDGDPPAEGTFAQPWSAGGPPPCYQYYQGTWWSASNKPGGGCSEPRTQIYSIYFTLTDGTGSGPWGGGGTGDEPFNISRDAEGYEIVLVPCSDL